MCLAGQRVEPAALNAMDQLARLAGRGHEVIPAPCDVQPLAQPEDAVRDGITMMRVVEEPAIEPGLTQSFLDRIELHISADVIPAIFTADAGRAPAGQTLACNRKERACAQAVSIMQN